GRKHKAVHIFILDTGQDDYVIVLLDDYLKQISQSIICTDRTCKVIKERKQGELEVFEWLQVHVIASKLETRIEHLELGRKEVLSLLNRRRCKGVMLVHLERKRL
ncbi:hypothetical protein ES288_D07G260900v1, partial [Gossypium darwinii]